jgi:electron transfer flavoprotein beta subunit
MGCDEAWIATDPVFAGADTWATSLTLSRCIKTLSPYDIVLCGLKSTDGDTGQVGPELAHQLGIPHICYVNIIEAISDNKIRLTRILDDGFETLESSLPVLITVSKDINQPRLPTLKGRIKARKTDIKKLTSKDLNLDESKLGLDGSPTRVVKIFSPPPPSGGEVIEGTPEEIANRILEKLIECRLI